jgi:hypothetical protein
VVSGETEPSQTWHPEESLAGLYRLYLDGQRGYATALVDRSKSRAEQIEALGALDWPPAQPLSAIYDRTVAATLPKPYIRKSPFAGDRCVSPFMANLPVYIDLEDQPNTHPVATYLWPAVTPERAPILEPGEEIRARWKTRRPSGVIVKPNGEVGGASPYPSSYLRDLAGYITNRRLIIVGRLKLPNAAREDYSIKLGMISPTLDDVRATVKQVKRWKNRRNVAWALHVRHEWLQLIEWGTLSPPNKQGRGIFHSRADDDQHQQVFKVAIKYPFGAIAIIDMKHPTAVDAPEADQLRTIIVGELEAAVPGVSLTEMESKSGEIPGGMLLKRKDVLKLQRLQIEGAVPYSLPERLETPARSATT